MAAREKNANIMVQRHVIYPLFPRSRAPFLFQFSSSPALRMVLFYIFSKKKLKNSYIQSTCFRSPMSRGWEMVVWYCSEDSICRGGDSNLWRFTLALRVWLPSMYIKHRRCTCIYILPLLSSCKSMLFIWHPAGPTQISSSLIYTHIHPNFHVHVFAVGDIVCFILLERCDSPGRRFTSLAFHTGA